MIHSMTGFAAVTQEVEQGSLSLELRSVNSRYLEVHFRLDEPFRALEPALREQIGAALSRGKVECRLNFTARHAGQTPLRLNTALAEQLAYLGRSLHGLLPDSPPLGVADLLRWPGVIESESINAEDWQEACLSLLRQGLDEFSASRQREGEKLKAFLLQRAGQMDKLVASVQPNIPRLVAAYQEKLSTRLKEAMVAGDDDRIRQEIAMFAQKIDVDEELSRLQTHLSEMKRTLEKGGTVGKRLDFLMQEFNREANTLGSKSVATEISQTAMELKVLIEQMREQIQNIE
ncbi:MAG TPA: YicC/YloC family endoribonuclease [Sulfuricella sp.]|nr:YicC/YloC family endoribonuclease [Sulfuricella sp.]